MPAHACAPGRTGVACTARLTGAAAAAPGPAPSAPRPLFLGGRRAPTTATRRRGRPGVASRALSPTTPGPEIWVGAAVPLAVFALGAWEFTKRILIQRRCAVCAGTGLVTMGGGGGGGSSASSSSSSSSTPRLVKCRACGGFFPWQSWSRFLSSAPGNGGPLQQPTLPRQTGVVYRVPSVEEARAAAAAARGARVEKEERGGE